MEEPGEEEEEEAQRWDPLVGYTPPDSKNLRHRAGSAAWLRAQATNSFAEVKHLAQQESGVKFVGDIGIGSRSRTRGRSKYVTPPEPDEQTSEWAEILQGETRWLKLK
jgi:hypothetical protein